MSLENISGWRKWFGILLLILVLISFVFFGLSYYMQSMMGGGDAVAVVNGEPVKREALRQVVQTVQREQPNLGSSSLQLLYKQALSRLIFSTATQKQMKDSYYRISDKDMQAVIH